MRVALITILLVVSGFSRISRAQTSTNRDAVLKVVQAFFDTMTAKDVDGARDILVPQGRFHAMRAGAEPRSLSNEEYLAQLQASKQTMRERIWNPEVRMQALIATLWAPYDFWYDAKLDHQPVVAIVGQ